MIESRRVTLVYGDQHALAGVDLRIEPRGLTAVTGHSGSGKSSLVHVLSGLARPTKGAVLLDGVPLTQHSPDRLRSEEFAFIFQDHFLLMHLSAFENVVIALQQVTAEGRAAAARLLERLGILAVAERSAWRLSGGERQRVAVARGLVRPARYVFADEPTAALDRASADAVYALLREVARDRAVVLVTHDPAAIEAADRVIEMRDGRVAVRAPRPSNRRRRNRR